MLVAIFPYAIDEELIFHVHPSPPAYLRTDATIGLTLAVGEA
jgi:hypothetical protein